MLLELKDVSKTYTIGTNIIRALQPINVSFDQGEFVAVMGPSGSGKSTFLQIASTLGLPSTGTILLKSKDVTEYSESQRAHLRNREIGFVFQQFNLLARTSALENVMLPLTYGGVPYEEKVERSRKILEKVGLGDRLDNKPNELSGGQQQRVAIARALVTEPSIIFADEPTGNLDSQSGEEIKQIFQDLHREGKTIIMVTHDADVAKIAPRHIHFTDGKISSDKAYKVPKKNKK